HLPSEAHGMGLKSADVNACFCCSKCHDVLDGRVPNDDWHSNKEWYMRRAQYRTLKRWVEMGMVVIK
ncbi:MAG: DUF1364 family protein, partial [Mariprofundaceae bacterium]|nr:DUF1364 family protein [Mariprofundaceae bacterium]